MSEARLTAAIVETHADIDGIQEDNADEFKAKVQELLHKPEKRDLAVWNEIGVERQLILATPESLLKLNGGKQDARWRLAVAGLWVAARAQAVMFAFKEAATIAEKQRIVKEASKLSPETLADFAPRGPKKEQFDAAKERRRNGQTADTADTAPAINKG